MAGWFVYQRDVYPSSMDPDSLGAQLVPEYDAQRHVVYLDADTPDYHGLRRVRSRWGVDPDIVQFDIVIHTPPTNPTNGRRLSASPPQSTGPTIDILVWTPRTSTLRFTNHPNCFQFENQSEGQCVYVARDTMRQTNHVTLMTSVHSSGGSSSLSASNSPILTSSGSVAISYTQLKGVVVGIRVHTLTLVAPGPDKWFARQVTARTTSGARDTCTPGGGYRVPMATYMPQPSQPPQSQPPQSQPPQSQPPQSQPPQSQPSQSQPSQSQPSQSQPSQSQPSQPQPSQPPQPPQPSHYPPYPVSQHRSPQRTTYTTCIHPRPTTTSSTATAATTTTTTSAVATASPCTIPVRSCRVRPAAGSAPVAPVRSVPAVSLAVSSSSSSASECMESCMESCVESCMESSESSSVGRSSFSLTPGTYSADHIRPV